MKNLRAMCSIFFYFILKCHIHKSHVFLRENSRISATRWLESPGTLCHPLPSVSEHNVQGFSCNLKADIYKCLVISYSLLMKRNLPAVCLSGVLPSCLVAIKATVPAIPRKTMMQMAQMAIFFLVQFVQFF